ncbi:MAG: hypothetical protein ABEH38_06125 [Flavobacteriales bacterium]
MELKGKKVLLVSPQPWGGGQVSKHHYARELNRRGVQVFFLEPPSGKKGKERFRIKEEVMPGLYVVLHESPLSGLRFYPPFIRKRLMKEQVRKLERLCAPEGFDIVWSFEGSRFFDLELFGPESLKVFHMVDLVQDHNLSKVAGTADLVLCTTSFIETRLSPYTSEVNKIPHGYAPSGKEEGTRKKGKGMQVAYMGNLSIPYLDRELIKELLRRFPDPCFHFFGPAFEGDAFLERLKEFDNAVLHGPLPAEDVRSSLASMDILLILYNAESYRKQVAAPHKMMDYLASGKAVVATWMEEHREHCDLIRMVERQEDFIPAFEEVIRDLDIWNSPELQKRRKAIAETRTYDKLLDRILEKAREAKPTFFR